MSGDKLIIGGKSINIPLNPRDNPTSAQLNNDEIGEILSRSFDQYKKYMIAADGRPFGDTDFNDIDRDKDEIERLTFSEGVAYVLLRALWVNDKTTFVKVWNWARNNLQRKNISQLYDRNRKRWINNPARDYLFAWRYNPDVGGEGTRGGVVYQDNSWRGASDADLDIAAALGMAAKKWNIAAYRDEARNILKDCWKKYIVMINGRPYLLAGDHFRERFLRTGVGRVNPSYMRPVYFDKLFPELDPSHNWKALTPTSYEIIEQSGKMTLNAHRAKPKKGSANLPPNWVSIRRNGELTITRDAVLAGGQLFGHDAFRTLFFAAWHYAETGSSLARRYLYHASCNTPGAGTGPYCFLKSELTAKKMLLGYNHDGTPVTSRLPAATGLDKELYTMYGAYLPYFYFAGNIKAAQQSLNRLQGHFYKKPGYWESRTDYYGQNWAWLGLALINYNPTKNYTVPKAEEVKGYRPEMPLPEGFLPKPDRTPEFSPDFIQHHKNESREAKKRRTDEKKGRISTAEEACRLGLKEACRQVAEGKKNLFKENSSIYFLQRDIGNLDQEFLNEALKHASTPYHRSRVAYILTSGKPDKGLIEIINKLGYGKTLPPNTQRLNKEQKLGILKEILKAYRASENKRVRNPLLEAEILLQMGILQKDLADRAEKRNDSAKANKLSREFKDNFAEAEGKLKICLRSNKYIHLKAKKGFERIIARNFPFLYKIAPYNLANETTYTLGQASALYTQLLLFQARATNKPLTAFAKFAEAYDFLKKGAVHLGGFHFSQAKELAAESLTSAAYIIKDLGKTFQQSKLAEFKKLLGEKYFAELERRLPNSTLFDKLLFAAEALLNDVINWKIEYDQMIPKNQPLWLQEIGAYSNLWLAKLKMAEAGETHKGKPKEYINTQKAKLEEAAGVLLDIKKTYAVLDPELIADIERNLGENFVLQAFTGFSLGNRDAAFKLLNDAIKKLEEASRTGSLTTRAEAYLWMAKALVLKASKASSPEEKKAYLAAAKSYLDTDKAFAAETVVIKDPGTGNFTARKQYRLKGTVLSSAFQTYGDILSAEKSFAQAEDKYRQALGEDLGDRYLRELFAIPEAKQTFAGNFEARASLGDVLNWQGKHELAKKEYEKVPADSKIYPQAQLGLAESTMRLGEVYSPESIANMERLAVDIFGSQPSASFLITRALQGLFEAYRTNENLQERIIYIGRRLLGEEHIKVGAELAAEDKKACDRILASIDDNTRAAFEDRARVEIYLRIAETLLWRKKFDDVLSLLKDIPAGLKSDFETGLRKAPELLVLRDLIKAEAKMRRDKDADPYKKFLALGYDPKQTAINEKEPDLAARIVLDNIEAFTLEKDWEEAVKSARNPIIPLSEMQRLFSGRKLSYEKYRFELSFKLADAYIGNKDFDKAEAELKSIKKDVEELKKNASQNKKEAYLVPTYRRLEARAYLVLGDIYSYRWPRQNYNASRKMYEVAVKLLKKDPSKKSRIILAKTYLGLGEIYRFGEGMRIYDRSKKYYLEAEKVALKLPEKSDDRWEILSKIYLGLALLEQENGDPASAWLYMRKSKMCLAKLAYPPDELEGGVNQAKQSIFDPNIILNWNRFSDIQATEDRFAVTLQLPFPFWRETMQDQLVFYAQNFTDTRLDASGRSIVNSTYLGARFRPALFNKLLALDFKGKIASGMLGEENSDTIPQNFRRPTFSSAGSFWSKCLTASVSYDLNLEESRLNTLYADAMLNLAFTKNPFAQIRLGGIFSDYYFTYWGDFRKRYFAGFGVNYELDIAAIIRALDYNVLKLKVNATLPIYEYEREAKHGYMLEDKLSHRFIHNGAPFRIDGCLQLNLGKLGVIEACGGGNIQNTPEYQYSNWNVGVGYRNSLF